MALPALSGGFGRAYEGISTEIAPCLHDRGDAERRSARSWCKEGRRLVSAGLLASSTSRLIAMRKRAVTEAGTGGRAKYLRLPQQGGGEEPASIVKK